MDVKDHFQFIAGYACKAYFQQSSPVGLEKLKDSTMYLLQLSYQLCEKLQYEICDDDGNMVVNKQKTFFHET